MASHDQRAPLGEELAPLVHEDVAVDVECDRRPRVPTTSRTSGSGRPARTCSEM
jgi:hypothetical protein